MPRDGGGISKKYFISDVYLARTLLKNFSRTASANRAENAGPGTAHVLAPPMPSSCPPEPPLRPVRPRPTPCPPWPPVLHSLHVKNITDVGQSQLPPSLMAFVVSVRATAADGVPLASACRAGGLASLSYWALWEVISTLANSVSLGPLLLGLSRQPGPSSTLPETPPSLQGVTRDQSACPACLCSSLRHLGWSCPNN
jgi:hypothetical protein